MKNDTNNIYLEKVSIDQSLPKENEKHIMVCKHDCQPILAEYTMIDDERGVMGIRYDWVDGSTGTLQLDEISYWLKPVIIAVT